MLDSKEKAGGRAEAAAGRGSRARLGVLRMIRIIYRILPKNARNNLCILLAYSVSVRARVGQTAARRAVFHIWRGWRCRRGCGARPCSGLKFF